MNCGWDLLERLGYPALDLFVPSSDQITTEASLVASLKRCDIH